MNSVLLFVVSTLLLSVSCQYKYDKATEGGLDTGGGGNNSAGGGTPPGVATPGFAEIRSQVLAPSCFDCHSAARGNRGGINLETYQNTQRLAQAVLASVQNNSMPMNRAPLSAQQKALLKAWVEGGAPENAIVATPTKPGSDVGADPAPPSPAPQPDPGPRPPENLPEENPDDETTEPSLDWATVNTLVIEPSCVGCHSEPSNRGGVNLESYRNTLRDIEDIEEQVRSGSMPIRSTLTPLQKKLILNWINAGAPEFAK